MKWTVTALRALVGLLIAGGVFILWHETLGRFMFFEMTDPPAADPHRDKHLRDTYILVFSAVTIVMALIGSVKSRLIPALFASIIPCIVFLFLRARGIPQVFNPNCEELYWGSRTMLVTLPLTLAVVFGIKTMKEQPTTNSTLSSEDAPSNES
jgi:hypothetical protein